jgi:hypothetical protein
MLLTCCTLSSPMHALSSVDLPEPTGPTTASSSPALTLTLTFRSCGDNKGPVEAQWELELELVCSRFGGKKWAGK